MSKLQMTEVEFKYNAEDITLTAFTQFCKAKSPIKSKVASGWDLFYTSKKDPDSFYRHRTGPDMNQLTYKKKTSDTNNFIRDEQNVDLSKSESIQHVKSFLSRFKYEYANSLFKNCFIYEYDYYTLVYYVCYDENMNELGRFIEIELSETIGWENEKEAFSELVILEKLCKPLGLTPQGRVKRSLFEMYGVSK